MSIPTNLPIPTESLAPVATKTGLLAGAWNVTKFVGGGLIKYGTIIGLTYYIGKSCYDLYKATTPERRKEIGWNIVEMGAGILLFGAVLKVMDIGTALLFGCKQVGLPLSLFR